MLASIDYQAGHAFAAKRNDTATQLPNNRLITEAFLDYAAEHPSKLAVIAGDASLTYGAMVERCAVVSNWLRTVHGATENVCVGIYVEPSLELMIGIWGTMLAGKAYVPLSPEYPDARVRYMIEDSQVSVIIAQEKFREGAMRLAPSGTLVTSFEEMLRTAGAGEKSLSERFGRPARDSLAYVIYTSGSTGQPNGVMIEHHSLINQMHWLRTECGLDETAVILQKTPMSFDAAQCEILALSGGSTVVMGAPGVYRDPAAIIEAIVASRATHAIFVPTLLQALLDTEEFWRCSSLTHIYCGGEALSKRLALECSACLPHCRLINMYGPTECTINTSATFVDATTVADGPDVVSIGPPIINTQYYIVRAEDGRLAGVGEIGELYIAGDGLARGYLNRPALTSERFVTCQRNADGRLVRLYKTGDLTYWNEDGTVQYVGRADSQVKLRGYRIELDEIKSQIEKHGWVKRAAVVVKTSPRTGYQNLIGYVELDPRNAALMDQNHHSAHHQSKKHKQQVLMQIANPGGREPAENAGKHTVKLPCEAPNHQQLSGAFGRKTYRFFEGDAPDQRRLVALLSSPTKQPAGRSLRQLSLESLGEILRYFGAFTSSERLLPKFAYASPGALYATQMYFELAGFPFLRAGIYYYDPYAHTLVFVHQFADQARGEPQIKVHFIGKRRAIEPVYLNNILEVLEIEVGHMIGLFERVLPSYGLAVLEDAFEPAHKALCDVDGADFYLGTYRLLEDRGERIPPEVELYIQPQGVGVRGLTEGLYRFASGKLDKIASKVVRRHDVIAINQAVYDRSSFGVTIVSRARDWRQYINLGRELQRLQMADSRIGLMSSGYSSKTGNDLPSAKRIREILADVGVEVHASYFAVGGGISCGQFESQGMNEDAVHMKGPAELLYDDLARILPPFMMPNQVILVPEMPLTVNGKIDVQSLRARDIEFVERDYVAPRNIVEEAIHEMWLAHLKQEQISVTDNFFELGGNSLVAVNLTNKVNSRFGTRLPLQVIFTAPTIERLAKEVKHGGAERFSRLVPLKGKARGRSRPIFCWPGLGGYCMNLRQLAHGLDGDRPFYGVQAHGINAGEEPYATVAEMARRDIELIKELQPRGPYTLWGYSFGARVAFESAYQLEAMGETVESLGLLAPGSPIVRTGVEQQGSGFENQVYLTILFSVFTGDIHHPSLPACLARVKNEEDFIRFVASELTGFDAELVRRIMKVVSCTFEFRYSFRELQSRTVQAPITIVRAAGDDYSFIEGSEGYSTLAPRVISLAVDHYGLLRRPGVDELVRAIQGAPAQHAARTPV
jgi:amino acid adenylation domain-containing protein